jgi:putative flippase GtrA
MTEEKDEKPVLKDVSTTRHASRYFIIGVLITLFNFGLYTLIARFIINNNDLLWLATLISSTISTIVAYILHSRITWKERNPGKLGIYKFFIWNFLFAFTIGPFCTWVFGLITPLYEFAYNISSAIHLPFDFEFVQSTGVFVLTAIVTMILNFIFYDKFIFGKKKAAKEEEKE